MEESKRTFSLKIAQYDKSFNLIKIFPSASSAAKSFQKKSCNAILDCCRGKKKSAFGYYWKFYDEETEGEINE